MAYRELIKDHYDDLNNLNSLLNSMVNSYRLLIAGASELYSISLAKKSDVKDAIDRANKLGDVIDDLLDTVQDCGGSYFKYCTIMSKYVKAQTDKNNVLTEVDYELDFDNSERDE
ncbi:hypothetical protein [Clostridium septicum]|uniref:Uncharacterized protein n=1 Tax=Clostridium septicum TaxID=1504 RepID=A0A9N7JKU0_CLOSE|nr:hypothetical protein [Clostridium septicum]AYE33711.1 hypothetical protein CP523_04100 [Clostridium septicum]MDU1313760.1 hypothetical protein [Clostridium septicum]QAS61866.1 hypothetical protein EI377_14620 [Clostridium septicum]UEC21678.1 hypothetical protein LK444_04740 [Clostridium septicum]USS00270.1 hypothetical protein NH397_12340 [Clostridium septicum]